MPYSDNYANMILDWSLGKRETLPVHNRVFLGFSTNDTTDGTFTELSGDTYGRILINQLGETYPGLVGAASGRVIASVKQIAATKATINWDTVNGVGLFLAETGGSPFWYGKLKSPVTTPAGGVLLFDAGNFQIAISDEDIEITATTA